MSRRGRPAAREGRATEGAADYVAMFETMMTSIKRRMSAPGPSVDVGDQVQSPRLMDHLDDSFRKLVEEALRHENLFPKEGSVVAVTREESKPQQSGNKKRKQQQQKGKDGQKKPKGEVTCYNCQQKGHFSKDCKNPKVPMKCHNCDKPGHIRKNCPEPRKDKQIVQAYALELFHRLRKLLPLKRK